MITCFSKYQGFSFLLFRSTERHAGSGAEVAVLRGLLSYDSGDPDIRMHGHKRADIIQAPFLQGEKKFDLKRGDNLSHGI